MEDNNHNPIHIPPYVHIIDDHGTYIAGFKYMLFIISYLYHP